MSLTCHGCAQSAPIQAPGAPSGDLACQFCVRNSQVRAAAASGVEPSRLVNWWRSERDRIVREHGHFPIDNYRTLDYVTEVRAREQTLRRRIERFATELVELAVKTAGAQALEPLLSADAERRLRSLVAEEKK